MAKQKTYTQAELESVKQQLAELPDLSRDKIVKADMLESLKAHIITLATTKGYTQAEIKSALSSLGVTVSIREIGELIQVKKNALLEK